MTIMPQAVKVSRRMRRVDSIAQFRNPPHFTSDARHTLRQEGEVAFYARYGKYYVGAFVLGAEGAVCFESSQQANSEIQVWFLSSPGSTI